MVCDKVVCHKEAEDAEAEEAKGTDLKTRTPHNVVGKRAVDAFTKTLLSQKHKQRPKKY